MNCLFASMTGRGFKSHAYTHSVQDGHHVFLNLETHKFYCLPDNYEIIDQSLEDIVVSVYPLVEKKEKTRQNYFEAPLCGLTVNRKLLFRFFCSTC